MVVDAEREGAQRGRQATGGVRGHQYRRGQGVQGTNNLHFPMLGVRRTRERSPAVLFIFNSLTEGRPSVWRLSETGVDADVRSNLRVVRRQGQHRGTLRHPQRESQGRHPDPQRGATDLRKKGRRGELPQCFCKRLEVRK